MHTPTHPHTHTLYIQVQLPSGTAAVNHALAAGRFATETEDNAPEYMGSNVKEAGGTILHGTDEF